MIEEKENSGIIALYGPAARLGEIYDKLCILSYLFARKDEIETIKLKIVFVDQKNKSI
jgi:aspartate 1-decarboxylase